ncbi:MAG: hypothetical protein HC837_19625, partial [Chloroflexaceae bacterium]|nr:hypothetical protein [Chloroflexaceae bacterium]
MHRLSSQFVLLIVLTLFTTAVVAAASVSPTHAIERWQTTPLPYVPSTTPQPQQPAELESLNPGPLALTPSSEPTEEPTDEPTEE